MLQAYKKARQFSINYLGLNKGAASTAAGTKVWVVDNNHNVYVYNNKGELQGLWAAGLLPSNAIVEGIATNGSDVWIVDGYADRVYRYSAAAGRLSDSQNAVSNFSLNNGNKNPKDIVTDGTYLWVVNDSASDKVFKYTVAGTLVASWTITTPGASSPTGITLDPSNPAHLWIVDNGTDWVYEYSNAVNQANGSTRSANTSFALAPGNTNPQGIADPPVLDEQAMSGEGFSSSSTVPALHDFAIAQLLDGSPARSTADTAPISPEKLGRLPAQSRREDAVVAIASGNPAPAIRPMPARTAGQPFEKVLDAMLAEWDIDESLAFLLL